MIGHQLGHTYSLVLLLRLQRNVEYLARVVVNSVNGIVVQPPRKLSVSVEMPHLYGVKYIGHLLLRIILASESGSIYYMTTGIRNTHSMMTDTLPIADCPRRQVYNASYVIKIKCKRLPMAPRLPYKEYKDHPELYRDREVSIADCEKCQDKELPSLRTQLLTYAIELKKWVKGGGKERTDEEVERIWNICQRCDALNDDKCMDCGCTVGLDGRPFQNKLKMDTTHCIRGLW